MGMLAVANININPAAAAPNALPPGVDWISAPRRPRRLGLSLDAVWHYCRSGWGAEGKAKLEERTGGGRPAWLIRSDADPALGRYVLPADVPVEIVHLTETQRAEWAATESLLKEWQERCRAAVRAHVPNSQRRTKVQITEAFVQEKRALGIAISARTLHRWHRQSRGEKGRGGLMDQRWQRSDGPPPENPFTAEVARLYLSRERLSLAECWRLASQKALENGWKVSARRTVATFIAKIPLAERVFTREGEKAYTDQCEPFIERDYSTLAANEAWNSDHHKLDLWVETGKKIDPRTGAETPRLARPWITVWQDMRSRKIVGWHVFAGDPCTDTIILSFKQACISYGLPDRVYTDNGRDFLSFALQGKTRAQHFRRRHEAEAQRLQGIFSRMKVEARAVQPYHGQSKPVERFFGTLESQCIRLWPTYCGSSPAERPEGLQKRLDSGQAPTLEELQDAVKTWIEGHYNVGPHFGDGMEGKSPDRVFAETLVSKRALPADVIDALCLKPGKPVKVGQNGVVWGKLRYGQHHDLLRRHMGRMVMVSGDPKDISRVIVQDLDGRFICAATINQRIPANASAAMHSEAMARKRRARKIDLAFRQHHTAIHETPGEIMYRIAAENQQRQAHNPAPEPVPMKILPPENPESIAQIQRALKAEPLKRAVGAEGMSLAEFGARHLAPPPRLPDSDEGFSILTFLNDRGGEE